MAFGRNHMLYAQHTHGYLDAMQQATLPVDTNPRSSTTAIKFFILEDLKKTARTSLLKKKTALIIDIGIDNLLVWKRATVYTIL